MIAAKQGSIAMAETLLEAGVLPLPAAASSILHPCGSTHGHRDAALQASSSIDILNNAGYTALMYAVEAGHRAVVELLLRHGAALCIATNEGS